MLKNMKINKRLILAFVIAVIISSIAGIVGAVLLNKIDSDYSEALVDYGFAQGDIGNLGRHFQKQRAATLYLLATTDTAQRETYRKELADCDTVIAADLIQVEKGLGSELGQKTYAKLTAAWQAYLASRNEVLNSNTTGEAGVALFHDKSGAESTAVSEIIDTMMADKSRIGGEKSTELTTQTVVLTYIMTAIMLGAFVIALGLAVSTAKGISKPVGEVENAAKEMAKGNYDVDITFTARDEIGSLADSMRSMSAATKEVILDTSRVLGELEHGNFVTEPRARYLGVFQSIEHSMQEIIQSLNSTMTQINQSSIQVSGGADQVSSGAQALSQGATEQASSVEELSATIHEMSEQIKKNAENASIARAQSEKSSKEVMGSNGQMQEMIVAMNDISNKSGEIGKIIKTIDDIAFQTNILALNAAVEAARAGAAGKGFAVVADEVRNLAGKSAEAAKNTATMIAETIKAIENGTGLADSTAKSMLSVVDGTNSVTQLVEQIAHQSGEQAVAISQVNMGMEQISAVVQTNSATAEESAAASEELSGQAQVLKNLVSKFKLRGGNSAEIDFSIMETESAVDSSFAHAGKY